VVALNGPPLVRNFGEASVWEQCNADRWHRWPFAPGI
jgi:hypothetical protein